MLEEYIRINDLKTCINATDDSKKTCLHIACREGHSDVVEYLVNKGWALEARDKLLSTPLQQACTSGHANIVSFLLLKGADPRAKDTLGRNSLLFAVCSPTTEAVEALLKNEVGLLDTRDYTGRSALHYSVFNPHPRQVDISRTLLEAGIGVDVPDNELKTPLHHACEAGKPRGIRLLLKWGANINAHDKSGKTPADLASNQSIKQLVTLYSKPTKEEVVKTSRLSSEKLPRITQKVTENRPSTPIQAPSQSAPSQTTAFREKLINLLRKVQETGVNSNQHIKKPSLYSGSWVEGIANPSALLNELATTPPGEAVIKVFNVLFPYPKALPVPQDDDTSGLDFFGAGVTKTPRQEAIYIQDDAKVIRLQQQLDTAEQNLRDIQKLLMSKEAVIQELQIALKTKTGELNTLQNSLQDYREKHQSALKQIPTNDELKAKMLEKEKFLQQIDIYKVKLEDCEKKLKEAKMLAESLKIELDQRPVKSDVEALKENIRQLEADDKNLRFKAGLLFLNSLENQDDIDASSPEAHLQDDEILKRLENALLGNSPNLKRRLADADGNKDGKVTKGELTKVLGTLCLPPQDIIVLLRIVGFRKGVTGVSIDIIADMVSSRQQRKENLESTLFSNLTDVFAKSSMSIEQAFSYLDMNKDGTINFQELSDACENLQIQLSRQDRHALFAVLDEDHSGTISLQELKDRLNSAPPPVKPPSSTKNKQPNNRYQEANDPTPASSERNATTANNEFKFENQAVSTNNASKQSKPINPVINEVQKPKEIQKNPSNKRVSGSLVIGVVRGKDLGQNKLSVVLHIDGAEKSLKTPVLPGPNPE